MEMEMLLMRRLYACDLIARRWFVREDDLPLFWEIVDMLISAADRHSVVELRMTAEGLFIEE